MPALPGESVNDSETRRRFTRALNEQNPEIVLLQEGINDLHVFDLYGIPARPGHQPGLVDALRAHEPRGTRHGACRYFSAPCCRSARTAAAPSRFRRAETRI